MSGVTGMELRSLLDPDGVLKPSPEEATLTAPESDKIIVRVQAAPINPSDLGLLLGPAEISLEAFGSDPQPSLTLTVPEERMELLRARIGQSPPVGNEGAGTVIDAGEGVTALLGCKVATRLGGMYMQCRKFKAGDAVQPPVGASAVDGAAMLITPLTALAFVQTARSEGRRAIVHTAAASNPGKTLQNICNVDGVPLVNIVRSAQQANILTGIGAAHDVSQTQREPELQPGRMPDEIARKAMSLESRSRHRRPLP